MKTTNTVLARVAWLGIALACLASRTEGASTSTFQLQMRSRMSGTNGMGGPQGWASSLYRQHGGRTNQSLEIRCGGLATNQVYHLMASWGTNGALMHVSDFTPNRAGAILMRYMAGFSHSFAGTNDPGPAWGMMGGWSNHMSWVVFPGSGTNWCDWMNEQDGGPQPMSMMGGTGGMGNAGQGMGENGGSGEMGGMGGMGGGWPAMTNWWSGMSNWWSGMAGWCWDYTNLWNAGAGYGGFSTNWWGSLGRGACHMMPLPASVNPVPGINGMVVMDGNLEPVLAVDLANPGTFTYQTRCDLRNEGIVPGARGNLRASATQRSTHFALTATGLAPSTTYFMAINGANRTPVNTDAHGRLRMRKLPSGAASMRGIGSISILDGNHNVVLSTALPPG